MRDIDGVLTRIESDFDFYLAVRRDPRRTLDPFELSSDAMEAFVQSGMSLWSLVLRRTARDPTDTPDGGLPPPPPPFVVHYSIPMEVERWRGDREAELKPLLADPTVQTAVRTIHGASTPPARRAAVAKLMELIG